MIIDFLFVLRGGHAGRVEGLAGTAREDGGLCAECFASPREVGLGHEGLAVGKGSYAR